MDFSNALVNARALAELAASASPWVPTRGPTKASDVTAEWLTVHVGSRAPGAVALSATSLGGTTGTTDRQRLAVEWNEVGKRAGLPANVFVKSSPLNAKNRGMVAALGMSNNEVRFYQQMADELVGVCPRSWYSYAGIGARFLIVLDDIVADGARPYALADHCEIEHARGLIDAFAALHSTFWESPRFDGDLNWVRTWRTRPGNAVLKRFYERGRRGALRLARPEATPAVHAVAAALDANIDAYYREFETGPLTLLHGDSHLGNTYSLPHGRSGLLDWQVIWRGPGLREITYWMITGLDSDIRRAHEGELLERYLDGLRGGGITEVPSYVDAYERYRLFSAEAWDAVAMTIAWPGLQAQENADAAWRRACVAVEDLDTAGAVRSLS
jgi:Phosphotransferase enzyme family